MTEPNDGMQPIYSLMSGARRSLVMTMYELADKKAVGVLEADARRRVDVRVLLDRDYSGGSVNASAFKELSSHGVHVRWAYAGAIFHQKSITVDGRESAIMTLNLTSEYYSSTRDFAVLTTNRADVMAVEQVFDEDWQVSGPPGAGQGGLNLVWSPGAEPALVGLIETARHSLVLENEEMDDAGVEEALETAARRGVNVRLVMTASPDWATALRALAAAGVHVATYAPDASLYIHAKVIVADDKVAFVGSQNFSVSSLNYNRELGIVTGDAGIVHSLWKTLVKDFAGGTPYTPARTHAWCSARAKPANDGYAGDYDVYVHSNQPEAEATAVDATDRHRYFTDASGYAAIYLWNTSPGEAIIVTVGGARCRTTA